MNAPLFLVRIVALSTSGVVGSQKRLGSGAVTLSYRDDGTGRRYIGR